MNKLGAIPKALLPIDSTPIGILIRSNDSQNRKAQFPIIFISTFVDVDVDVAVGRFTWVSLTQPSNTRLSILVRVFGILTLKRLLQNKKAPPPIVTTPKGRLIKGQIANCFETFRRKYSFDKIRASRKSPSTNRYDTIWNMNFS